jgi:hypothetical protein
MRGERRSSMRTLFEIRGRTWVVRALIVLAFGAGAYILARAVIH